MNTLKKAELYEDAINKLAEKSKSAIIKQIKEQQHKAYLAAKYARGLYRKLKEL